LAFTVGVAGTATDGALVCGRLLAGALDAGEDGAKAEALADGGGLSGPRPPMASAWDTKIAMTATITPTTLTATPAIANPWPLDMNPTPRHCIRYTRRQEHTAVARAARETDA
jgi:hypothetical protein